MSHAPEAHAHEHLHEPDTLGPDATWDQLERGAVLAWWQLTRFLEVAGEEAATFLDGIVTQSMAGIEVGSARHALFLTTKARIIAPVVAYRAADDRFLLELDPELLDELVPHLKRYRLRAKASIEQPELGTISVVGPASSNVSGTGWYDSPAYGVPARTFVGTMDETAERLRTLVEAGVPFADPETVDAMRITAGMPSLADLAVGFMPAEVGGMEPAVALDKGCYLGQEPVARLHYRGHPNRTLRQVSLGGELPADYFAERQPDDEAYLALVRPDAPEGRPVGRLTSWATLPSGELVGLAILRRELEPGQPALVAGTEVTVTPSA